MLELEKTNAALKGLQEAVLLLDSGILDKKTDLEKRGRLAQKELEEKTKSLNELKATSEKVIANIDAIVAKLSGVL